MITTSNNFTTFKQDINLANFAALFGYEIDRKKSTKTSIAMKSHSDKVIISRKHGMWVYFSVSDDQDSGTIVDFVANRSNKTMPEIAQLLSDWSGLGAPAPYYKVDEPTYDVQRVQKIFSKCSPAYHHPYLESRGIRSDLLNSSRFRGRIFVDRFRNAVFPHYENKQVCGLELKNSDRGLLVKGSKKTFWRSNTLASDTNIIITEAVIDALSYQQLFQPQDTMYLATGGGVSQKQCDLLIHLLTTLSCRKIVIATDNDQGGDRIAERIGKTIEQSEFQGKISRHRPLKSGADWNDVLQDS